jgi:dTDP-glucose 4,6-dehydratase
VDDLVEGIKRLLYSQEAGPVNLGNPEEITILDFAKEIIRLTGSKSKIAFTPLPQNDPKVRQPDITKAKEILGWQPKITRQEGLKKTLLYFEEKLLQSK